MPGRSYGRRRRMYPRPIINSIKNSVDLTASTGTAVGNVLIAKAVNTPLSTNPSDVSQGSIIKALWLAFDVCGLAATGVLQMTQLFLIKNPGDNLTLPSPQAIGSSNEKKFIFREWKFMTMRNQDGNPPNHFEGWIPVPKRYQRMGTDDTFRLAFNTSTAAGHFSLQAIYKWYR